jgi:hypothetical protein
MTITHERVKEIFYYHSDGYLVWKERRQGTKKSLIAASFDKSTGYVRCFVDGKHYRAHRLIWFWHYGEWPSMDLDHEDEVKTNNKIENLRIANDSKNRANIKKPKNNTSGYKGVAWNKWNGKWAAQIGVNYKHLHLGYFEKQEDAAKAYDKAAKEHFGEFAKTNF